MPARPVRAARLGRRRRRPRPASGSGAQTARRSGRRARHAPLPSSARPVRPPCAPGVGSAAPVGASPASDVPHADEPGRDGAGGAWNDAMDGLARADPRRAGPGRQSASARDRARPVVAGRPRRPDRRGAAARRPRRVGDLQPALDGRPAVRGGALRADRHDVHRSRPARRGTDPRLPRLATAAWRRRPSDS